jgi:hypothetical protein
MGRTIPSFRIAVVLEEKKWKEFRKYLRNNNEKKLFTHMFSIANLYNSASSNAVNPIRIYPIMMSIVLHHYKALKEKNILIDKDYTTTADFKKDINNTLLLKREIDKWNKYSFVLRKQNRILFEEMLQASYKYSNAINAKGEQYSTESLLLSLVFDQHKLINNNNNNNKLNKNPRN